MTTATFTHHDQPIRLNIRRDHVDAAIAAVAFVLLLPGAAWLHALIA